MKRKRYSYQDVLKMFENEGYKVLSTEGELLNEKGFIYASTRILVQCPNNNHEPSTKTINHFLKGQRCKKCKDETSSLNKCRNEKDVIDYIESQGYIFISMYRENKSNELRVKMICPKGHEYDTRFNNFKNGYKCRKCSGYDKKDIEYVREKMKKEGHILLSDKYNDAKTILEVECPKNHIYKINWNNFQQGKRCPYCNESKGEEKICKWLEENNLKYIRQYKFNDCKFYNCLPFDFYLPDINILIEYDGIQHFQIVTHFGGFDSFVDTKIRDTIKNEYCKKNNIKLVRIPYWEKDNIEKILIKELNL